MPHELDDLTDEQRANAPKWATEWVGFGERCTREQLADCEDIATHFAKALLSATAEIERLQTRQQELLVTIRNLSQQVPFPDEANQVPVLIAKVGTLKAALREATDSKKAAP